MVWEHEHEPIAAGQCEYKFAASVGVGKAKCTGKVDDCMKTWIKHLSKRTALYTKLIRTMHNSCLANKDEAVAHFSCCCKY